MSSNIKAENKQSPSPITSLPEDVVVDILARVPVCDYPRVSLVSKYFRSLVSSPEIYARRSSLGCTEHCLYVVLFNWKEGVNRLYTLRQKDKGLVLIPGLRVMPYYGSFVAMGSRIYVFCRVDAYIIDCTSHTVQDLPMMPVLLYNTVADVIGGRIYIFGRIGTYQKYTYAMAVFDVETQTWEETRPVTETLWDEGVTKQVMNTRLAVMAGKMYIGDRWKSFVYDPKESKWETDEVLSYFKLWIGDACVVGDVLYFHDRCAHELRGYDPEHKCWVVVKGVGDLIAEMRRVDSGYSRTVSCGGKLVWLYGKEKLLRVTKEICCAEISLERRKGGQIWGRIDQWCDYALIAGVFTITKSLDVVL